MNQREIKFRGVCNLNAQWVYGSLVQGMDQKGNPFTQIEVANANEHRVYYVQPDTVGQYTGRKDCDNKELYEGDVYQRYSYFYQIIWYNESASFKGKVIARESFGGIKKASDEKGRLFNITSDSVTRLVGNIYENPELIK